MTSSRFAALAAAVALAAPPAAGAEPDALDAALKAQAPKLIDHLRAKGHKAVGVLKFLVRHGDGPPRDDAGELNMSLATKTELALILANPDEALGVLRKPCQTVTKEKNTLANHLDTDGRKAFFNHKYEMAWSNDPAEATGFLTGTVALSDDLREATVRFQLFDRTGAIHDLPAEVRVPTTPRLLAEAGHSYVVAEAKQTALVSGGPAVSRDVRSRIDDAVVADIARTALKAKANPPAAAVPVGAPAEPFDPLAESPVKWTVLHNGTPVCPKGDTVAEPTPADKVEFKLENPTGKTFAVVLLVNGENTLYRERAAPWAARKWVLTPGSSVTVSGFQTDDSTSEGFKVLRPEESEADAVNYGDHAGTYRMVVFRGELADADPEADRRRRFSADDSMVLAIARGAAKAGGPKPLTLEALKADLLGREKNGEGARGLVVKGGPRERSAVGRVFFKPTPDVPVADVTLRYYTPKGK